METTKLDCHLHDVLMILSWEDLNGFFSSKKYDKVFLLVDTNTKNLCLPYFMDSTACKPTAIIEIPAGESHKTLATCQIVWNKLHKHKATKNSVLINLGGGVVCDLGGFCASVYKRGMKTIHIPTTLLAQADAAIGGKTGVDFHYVKNMIGRFYLPEAVWIDTHFLKTLPDRQLINGMAEVIKHGLISNTTLFEKITSIQAFQTSNCTELVKDAIAVKCAFIDKDPYEKGLRKTLNFGHTAGHSIESLLLKNGIDILHGEAVAAGMKIEAHISELMGMLSNAEVRKIDQVIDRHFPFLSISAVQIPELIELMGHDKKNQKDKISFSLLKSIGTGVFDHYPDLGIITFAFMRYIEQSQSIK